MLPSRLPVGDRRFIKPDAYVEGFDHDYPDDAFEFAAKQADTSWEALSATYQRTIDPIQLAEWLNRTSQEGNSSSSRGDDTSSSSLYQPIRNSFEIRVLEIYPGERDDDLYGALRHCSIDLAYRRSPSRRKNLGTQHGLSLEDNPVPVWYTALSYTWGPNVFDHRFHCGSHIKYITKSLDTALRHFRLPDKTVVMWIDQICINQDDLDEKVGQIKLMSRIYTHAFNTVLWLGEGAEYTQEGIDLLGSFKDFFLSLPPVANLGQLGMPPPLGTKPWEGLWDILARPWFTRLWTAQEAVLSRYRWVMCGENLVDWDDLTAFTCRLEESDIQPMLLQMHAGKDQDTRFFRRYHASWLLEELTNRHRDGHGSKFDLLTTVRHTLSWDPRDKTYGLLGIMTPQEAAKIKVSYEPDYTMGQVYEQVTVIDIEDSPVKIASVLACVDHDPETTHPSLPSWVPDWSQQRETTSIAFNTTEAHVYNASGMRTPGTTPTITYTHKKETREIWVRARKLGVIAQASDIFLEQPLPQDPLQIKGDSGIRKLVSIVTGLSPNPYGDDLFDALWQTMVAARHDRGSVAGVRDEFAELFSLIFDEATGGSPSQPSLPGQTYTARQRRPAGRGKLELSNLLTRKPSETYQLARTAAGAAMKNRRVAVLDNGFLTLVPLYVRQDDWVCLFEGVFFRVPLVVRPKEGKQFTFLGESYVHGVMGGEFAKRDDMPWEDIALV